MKFFQKGYEYLSFEVANGYYVETYIDPSINMK